MQIIGREKTPFSIWRKIQNKKISLEQLLILLDLELLLIILKIVIKLRNIS